jgi:4-hydroxybenzoate polyprenyltransferase
MLRWSALLLKRFVLWVLMSCIACCGMWVGIYNLLHASSKLAIFGAACLGFFNLCGLIYTFKNYVLDR